MEAIEKMYVRKTQKALKLLAKAENDPLNFLVPSKESENVDLKRQLDLKMVGLQQQTDKAILAILKRKLEEDKWKSTI